jgi:plasmid stability protein
MASLQLNDVPEAIMSELRERAERFHRPVEEEAKATLMNAILASPSKRRLSVTEFLARAKRIRDKHPNAWITEEFLRAAKDEGRP